jgi:hypothetical protein
MLTFYSIATAMVGAILAIVILDDKIKDHWEWPVGSLSLSFLCFIWGFERFSDALDEDDLDKHLAWLVWYNAGVFLLMFGLTTFIFLHYDLLRGCPKLRIAIASVVSAIASSKWLYDFFWLLCCSKSEYEKYRKGITGETEPVKYPDRWTRRFSKRRSHRK